MDPFRAKSGAGFYQPPACRWLVEGHSDKLLMPGVLQLGADAYDAEFVFSKIGRTRGQAITGYNWL